MLDVWVHKRKLFRVERTVFERQKLTVLGSAKSGHKNGLGAGNKRNRFWFHEKKDLVI